MSDTLTKSLQINLDNRRYGAFAEIGAGQEVARFFFQAGKASNTIAKTMSAYDMIISDEIYGREMNGRYVCESRLQKMLNHEYSLLVERLKKVRGDHTTFFAFANTVATATVDSGKQSHGWMGVRFQSHPNGEENEIILHVRMLDRYRLQQQEVLGVLGVNLIHAAFYDYNNVEEFIPHLVEGLKDGQLVIDVIKFKGPDLAHFDNRLMNLELVRKGLAEAILFSPEKEILNISDAVYGKSLLIQRGTFRPVTNTHLDILQKGLAQLKNDSLALDSKPFPLMSLMELTTHNLQTDRAFDQKDFLNRIDMLCSLGQHVLISNFFLFFSLKRFLRRYNPQTMAIVIGASHLDKLFTEKHYSKLEGGLLEGLGKLLDSKTKIYVYPHKSHQTCITAKNFTPAPHLKNIYSYFISNNQITDISGCDEASEYIHSDDIIKMIKEKDPRWESLVPEKVRRTFLGGGA